MAKKVEVKEKEKKSVTAVRVIACILGVGIIAGGAACAGFVSRNDEGKYFRNSNFSTWHWANSPVGEDGSEQNGGNVNPGENNDSNQGGYDLGVGGLLNVSESCGISVQAEEIAVKDYATYSIASNTDAAYLITATVEPADALDKRLSCGVKWQDADSEWVTTYAQNAPVTNYVVASAVEGVSNQFAVSCEAAFGEPINVIIFSSLNPDVHCVIRVDYLRHLTSTENIVKMNGIVFGDFNSPVGGTGDKVYRSLYATTSTSSYAANSNVNTIAYEPTYGIGTVTGSFSCEITLTLPDLMKEELNCRLCDAGVGGLQVRSNTVTLNPITSDTFTIPFVWLVAGGGNYNIVDAVINNFYYEYGTDFNSTALDAEFTKVGVKCEVTYSYGNYSQTFTVSNPYMKICKDGLSPLEAINNITTDKDSILFY